MGLTSTPSVGLPITANHVNIKSVRDELGVSQSELARISGVSTRTIQSCEQGWRRPGPELEKAVLLLLMVHRNGGHLPQYLCWETVNCPPERREKCITYRTGQGQLCWFLHGTLCIESHQQPWELKRNICMNCTLFRSLLSVASDH